MSNTDHSGVEVSETGNSLYQNNILIGAYQLFADEPASLGGGDTGPNPMDLACAALGSCTTITLRMYANRKKWPLDRVSATVCHSKGPASDCEPGETKPGVTKSGEAKSGMVDIFTRVVTLHGALSDDQRQRLMEIAEKCPVHKALSGSSCVVTNIG